MTAMTTKPIPPIHWRDERQRRMLLSMESRFVKTVDPVVVIPEKASKTAFVMEILSMVRRKGREEKKPAALQERAIMANPCRADRPVET